MKKIQWAKNSMPKTADKQLAVMSLENVGKALEGLISNKNKEKDDKDEKK